MSEVGGKLDIPVLMQSTLDDFSNKIDMLEKNTLEYVLSILKDGNKNPDSFHAMYGRNICIRPKIMRILSTIDNLK